MARLRDHPPRELALSRARGSSAAKKRDTALFQLVLDLGAEVGAPGDTLDRLGDDGHETAVGPGGLGEQILDPPVTRNRDIELLVCQAVTALIEVLAAGFDVIEMSHDDEAGRKRIAGVPQLSGKRDRRVLGILGRRPAKPRLRNHRRASLLVRSLNGGRGQRLPPRQDRIQAIPVGG